MTSTQPFDDRGAIPVLYIIGKGRSGSTLLDMILGECDGYFSTGQLHRIWTQGLINRYECGCRKPIPECKVWSAVMGEAFGPSIQPERITRLQDRVLSWARAPAILRAGRRSDTRVGDLADYIGVMRRLYQAIRKVTGCRVIVDSSKAPAHPGTVGLIPGIEPFVIHLVRDPHAVAYSWRRRKRLTGRGDWTEMPRFGPLYSSVSWIARNLLADRTRRLLGPERSMLLRYEDLVADPRGTISAITRMVGEEPGQLPFTRDDAVRLSINHTVSGNPIRSNVGEVELRADREWTASISRRDKVTVSLLSAPIRRRYGY